MNLPGAIIMKPLASNCPLTYHNLMVRHLLLSKHFRGDKSLDMSNSLSMIQMNDLCREQLSKDLENEQRNSEIPTSKTE